MEQEPAGLSTNSPVGYLGDYMYNYDNELAEKSVAHAAYADYFFRLKSLAVTMFKWRNLPDSVNERFLEWCLFVYGRAVFFEHPTRGFMALNGMLEGINFYNEPLKIRPMSPAETFDSIDSDKCVLIRNTPDMYPTFLTTKRYAETLYDIDATIDINIKAQKTPVLILTDVKQKMSAQAMYQKYNGNAPVIYGMKGTFDPNCLQVLRTDAPFVAGQLQDIKITKYNEYLSFLGIGMADFKRERRVTDEVEQFDQQANALANIGLSQRKHACELINKLWGLNIDVELANEPYITEGEKYSKNASTISYIKSAAATDNAGGEE